MNQELQRINFYGSDLLTVERNGTLYVAMKPVCECIGVDWDSQRKKVMGHPLLSSTAVITTVVAQDGKSRKMVMLPINYIQGWLFMIDANRVAPEIKDKVITYQKECFDVLHDYWQNKSGTSGVDDSAADCFNELHVFLEVTRGRMNISQNGNQHNTVSMPTAQVLQYLYQHRTSDRAEISASASKLGKKLQIDRTTVSRSIIRLAKWNFLQRHSEPGRPLTVILNEEVISAALEVSRVSLLSNQQRAGFLAWH